MSHWSLSGDLPPVGTPVCVTAESASFSLPGYDAQLLNSGTAALSLALKIARLRRPEVAQPAAILPAYACPDLVAAAQFAGVRPVLVDINEADPGYDLAALAARVTDDVVAVVAVNFLGIQDRLASLREVTDARNIVLIEDDAQWFPEPVPRTGPDSDLICVSFGRGKPVNLMGGGALFVRSQAKMEIPAGSIAEPPIPDRRFAVKARTFNALLHRRLYWTINRNPLFSLGETVFKPLLGIRRIDPTRQALIAPNVRAYLAQERTAERLWQAALSGSRVLEPLNVANTRVGRLLRFPVLCPDQELRDVILQQLSKAGLGVTAMYRQPLPEVRGMAGRVDASQPFPGAERFARHLLTLPVHRQVRRQDVERAMQIIERLS